LWKLPFLESECEPKRVERSDFDTKMTLRAEKSLPTNEKDKTILICVETKL